MGLPITKCTSWSDYGRGFTYYKQYTSWSDCVDIGLPITNSIPPDQTVDVGLPITNSIPPDPTVWTWYTINGILIRLCGSGFTHYKQYTSWSDCVDIGLPITTVYLLIRLFGDGFTYYKQYTSWSDWVDVDLPITNSILSDQIVWRWVYLLQTVYLLLRLCGGGFTYYKLYTF